MSLDDEDRHDDEERHGARLVNGRPRWGALPVAQKLPPSDSPGASPPGALVPYRVRVTRAGDEREVEVRALGELGARVRAAFLLDVPLHWLEVVR